ncbi:WD40 repeat-like protein [Radiomyces spectabilis]|uniref:WD40 repeat-like protein n=1 Tax=Radiomyces spectabilis TaxID=64574 RepID=UPI002220141E|nr:WD40 repeat-like protein [Radiomyces spectabilis]KAI8390883.1 WD40 repeat-like protein [Radiomyces spectabilis]
MKSSFKFSNLCGTVYTAGNLVFTPDGNSILSPVGNRVSVFDLVNNKSYTLPVEMRKNIRCMALSPKATLLITVDEDGRALLINFPRRVILHHFNFKAEVRAIQFSPDGRYIAVTHGKQVQVWKSPGFTREYAPFLLHNTYNGHYDDVLSIQWSSDSKYFVTASKDLTARIFSLHPVEGFIPPTLSGHRDTVLGAWFSDDMQSIYTVSKDSAVYLWKYGTLAELRGKESEDEMDVDEETPVRVDKARWRVRAKHPFKQNYAKVKSCEYFSKGNLLVIGFSNGLFGLYETPSFNNIHTLSISQMSINTVAINRTGEWLAFGSSKLGQLLVWEWQSETYVLKQQGHYYDMNTLSYSADGQTLATGGDDGKVKVWNTTSGFCFVTFNEHKSGVSAVEFAKQGQVLFSASLDGTVRAFDLVRYRNFRTFTSPNPVQFTSLAVDPSGEIVCAGTMDTFEIFVWSVQTGKLLDILAGHEGPISSLSFSPTGMMLASGSWDQTARTWDVFGRSKHIEALQHQTEVLAVAYRPDGKQVATATLDGMISFWDVELGKQTAVIEGRKDIMGGRKLNDRTSAENAASGKCFNSLCYTADGSSIIGGGSSKYICIYDIETSVLVKKFQISENLSLDGTQEMLNSKKMTEFGSLEEMEADEASDIEDRLDNSLPGTQKGDLSARRTRPEARSKCVRFSPTGRAWAAATTDGLLMYSLDDAILFDPFDLEIDITPETVMETLEEGEYLKALCMAFRLNEKPVLHTVFERIPPASVDLVARGMPEKYLEKLLHFLGVHMETSPHVEFHMMWVISVMTAHGRYLKDHRGEFQTVFRSLRKGVLRVRDDIANLCDANTYTLKYLLSQQSLASNNNRDIEA